MFLYFGDGAVPNADTMAAAHTELLEQTWFEGISDVRELMAAAYKPELATILGRCMHGILVGLEAGLQGQPIINTGF